MVRWSPRTAHRDDGSFVPKQNSAGPASGPGGAGGTGSGLNYPYGAPAARPRWTPPGARAASAVTFLAGVWLVSPFVLDYAPAAEGMGAYWNDLAVGAVIALLALVRTTAPDRLSWLSLVNAVLGAWLVAAPFALHYETRSYAYEAIGNDVIVGVFVLVMAVASAMTTYRRRRRAAGHEG